MTYITGTDVYKDALLEYESKKVGSFLLRRLNLSNESVFRTPGERVKEANAVQAMISG